MKFQIFDNRPFCPICKKVVHFSPLPIFYFENSKKNGYVHFGKGEMTSLETYSCSNCGASDRERLYAYWIDNEISNNRIYDNPKLVHFAPEAALSKWIESLAIFCYHSADLMMEDVDFKVDMMNLPFADEIFDCFICSHVLEHVESDDKAIQELYRILKYGGWGILMSPIIVGLKHTHEDLTKTSDEERWHNFGQNDHVRLYAHDDYINKIAKYGFNVKQLDMKYFGKSIFKKLGLKMTSILYIVEKNDNSN